MFVIFSDIRKQLLLIMPTSTLAAPINPFYDIMLAFAHYFASSIYLYIY